MIIRRMINITLIFCIFILGAGCTSSNGEKIFHSSNASSTDLPVTKVDIGENNCFLVIGGIDWMKLYVSDPVEKHAGISPNSGDIIIEIPGADYEINPSWGNDGARGDAISDPDAPDPIGVVLLNIPDPKDGLYTLQIHGTPNTSVGALSAMASCGKDSGLPRIVLFDANQEFPIVYQFTFSSQDNELMSPFVKVK